MRTGDLFWLQDKRGDRHISLVEVSVYCHDSKTKRITYYYILVVVVLCSWPSRIRGGLLVKGGNAYMSWSSLSK
jgi:hypothetical protein